MIPGLITELIVGASMLSLVEQFRLHQPYHFTSFGTQHSGVALRTYRILLKLSLLSFDEAVLVRAALNVVECIVSRETQGT